MRLLKFGAIWCAECIVMNSILEEIQELIPDLNIEHIDADASPEILKKFGIEKIPVFIFLDKEDSQIKRLNGIQNKEDLIIEIEKLLINTN